MAAANMRNTLACSFLALLVGACGLTDKDPSESQFCLEIARRECTAIVPRCAVVQQAGCENVRRTACESWVQRAKAGRAYQSGRAEKCLERVVAAYAKPVMTPTELDDLQAQCARVFGG